MAKRRGFKKIVKQYLKDQSSGIPVDRLIDIPEGCWPTHQDKLFRAARSRDFLVQLFHEDDGVIRMSVTKVELGLGFGQEERIFADGVGWDELQRLKEMAGYGHCMGLEIYPPKDQVVNVANMRHLWILPQPINIGWTNDNEPKTD